MTLTFEKRRSYTENNARKSNNSKSGYQFLKILADRYPDKEGNLLGLLCGDFSWATKPNLVSYDYTYKNILRVIEWLCRKRPSAQSNAEKTRTELSKLWRRGDPLERLAGDTRGGSRGGGWASGLKLEQWRTCKELPSRWALRPYPSN